MQKICRKKPKVDYDMSISGIVKSIQDIMRKDAGVDGDAQRIGQLAWMLFLKIFDDQEKEREIREENYISHIPEHLRWREWAGKDEGITGEKLLDFINNDLFKTLKELPGDEAAVQIIRNVFEDSNNYMKNGTLIRQVINKINEMDFNRSEDRHLFSEIYDKILKDLQSAGNAGEFYTPRAVTRFMTEMTDPKLGEIVMDPACGTGGFLTCTIDHKQNNYVKGPKDLAILQKSVFGIEKKQLPYILCVTNMLLHGIEAPSQIRHDNALREGTHNIDDKNRADVILTNPPFGGQEEDGIEKNFKANLQSRETADLFLVLIIRMLKEGGRCAIVLPDGTLFGDGIKARIKAHLLEECDLHTIVRLPNGVFNPYTGIKTNLLFFTKGKPTEEIWFYEHPYPEGCKSYSKTKPMRIEEFEPEKAWWHERAENEHAWKLDFKKIKADALSRAKPHWDESEAAGAAAMNLEAQVRSVTKDIAELKKADEKKNKKKIKDLENQQRQIQNEAVALREKAKLAKEAGDAVYWHIYNLDMSNPHQAAAEKRDSEKMLKEYKTLLKDIAEVRDQLKQELMNALGGGAA